MLRIVELLDRAKEVNGHCSDYRLAKLLGVSQQSIPTYRAGRAKPQNAVAVRLGSLCGLDPEVVACWVQIDWTDRPEEREFWLSMLARLGAPADDFSDSGPADLDPPRRQNVAVYKSGQKVASPRRL